MKKYYEFLSNGITSALIREGSVEWLPLSRFDSPSIFTRTLDKERWIRNSGHLSKTIQFD
ncbi:MAG: hypothetical protein OWQ54_09940 [Sulfolobaceae archaeon]|nr:hypothetical protein [Sulfolobaceae archaeon]